jgi:hypothetical protein
VLVDPVDHVEKDGLISLITIISYRPIMESYRERRQKRRRLCAPGLFVDTCIAFIIFLVLGSFYSTDLNEIKDHLWAGYKSVASMDNFAIRKNATMNATLTTA